MSQVRVESVRAFRRRDSQAFRWSCCAIVCIKPVEPTPDPDPRNGPFSTSARRSRQICATAPDGLDAPGRVRRAFPIQSSVAQTAAGPMRLRVPTTGMRRRSRPTSATPCGGSGARSRPCSLQNETSRSRGLPASPPACPGHRGGAARPLLSAQVDEAGIEVDAQIRRPTRRPEQVSASDRAAGAGAFLI